MITTLIERHARIFLTAALLLTLAGALAWVTMPRQEDPEIAVRGGLVIIPFPGADALTIERLIAEPVEESLEEVEEIDYVRTTIRDDVAIFSITLTDATTDADPVWDDVDTQLAQARIEFPAGVAPTQTRWNLFDLESVLVSISGHPDPLLLAERAETLRQRLLRVDGAARVEVSADPGEQITITLDEARMRSAQVSAKSVAAQLEARTRIIPAGTLMLDRTRVVIDPGSDFDSLDAIKQAPVMTATGATLRLEEIALVQREPENPSRPLSRYNGERAVIVGVVPEESIHVVEWGARVSEVIDAYRQSADDVKVEVITFQPDYVAQRLDGLGWSLVQGVGIVALILCLTMGLRMGLTLSAVVPLVALSSLFVFSQSGGLLQQFSIAGLVVSLGLLVDNAIVMGERIQELIDRGGASWDAARQAVSELSWPLLTATGTTIAAFMPLLLSKGPVGEFTRGIPWLVTTTLLMSLVFAITVTPVLSVMWLRPAPRRANHKIFEFMSASIARLPVRRPGLVLGAAALVMVAITPLAGQVKKEFFPTADRQQVLLELELREGTHQDHTSREIAKIERALLAHEDVESVTTFVGSSTPRFYYNLPLRPQSPHLAQVLVTLEEAETRWDMVEWARRFAAVHYPGDQFVARVLEQGPPTAAPIELRIHGDDSAQLAQLTEQVTGIVQRAPFTRDVRHDLPLGKPGLMVTTHDDVAAWRGLSRPDIALGLMAQTTGLPAGHLRSSDKAVPLRVRTGSGELSGANLDELPLDAEQRLASVAAIEPRVRPAAIFRRDGQRVVSVLAQIEPGHGFNEALDEIEPELARLDLPDGMRIEIGGAPEASGKANAAIGAAAPAGAAMLILCLLLQFRSLRRTGIILLTIPLSAVGVVPGLLIWDQPFGFQSLLGVLSLAGIVVNNAIILVDTLDRYLDEGRTLDEAIQGAVRDRLRPIVLTTMTTVLGLTPLLWSSSALWPPMASAMISGLLASTTLTLLVVPATCKLVFSARATRWHSWLAHRVSGVAATALVLIVSASPALAQDSVQMRAMTLDEAMRAAHSDTPQIEAMQAAEIASASLETLATRRAWLPAVQFGSELVGRTTEIAIATPIGDFVQQPQWGGQLQVVIAQPVLDLAAQSAAPKRAKAESERLAHQHASQRAQLAHGAAKVFLAQRALLARREALLGAHASLDQQRARIQAMLEAGRSTPTDLLRVQAALDELDQERVDLDAQLDTLRATLGQLTGANEPVSAQPIDWSSLSWEEPSLQATLHPEQEALRARLSELDAQRRQIKLSGLPTLSLQARGIHQINTPLATATWGELAIGLSWTPFAQGTRAAQLDLLQAQELATSAQLERFAHTQRASIEGLRARWRAHREAITTMTRVVETRERILDQVRAQYDAERAIITDVLQAEAELAESRARLRVARLSALERELDAALEANTSSLLDR